MAPIYQSMAAIFKSKQFPSALPWNHANKENTPQQMKAQRQAHLVVHPCAIYVHKNKLVKLFIGLDLQTKCINSIDGLGCEFI